MMTHSWPGDAIGYCIGNHHWPPLGGYFYTPFGRSWPVSDRQPQPTRHQSLRGRTADGGDGPLLGGSAPPSSPGRA